MPRFATALARRRIAFRRHVFPEVDLLDAPTPGRRYRRRGASSTHCRRASDQSSECRELGRIAGEVDEQVDPIRMGVGDGIDYRRRGVIDRLGCAATAHSFRGAPADSRQDFCATSRRKLREERSDTAASANEEHGLTAKRGKGVYDLERRHAGSWKGSRDHRGRSPRRPRQRHRPPDRLARRLTSTPATVTTYLFWNQGAAATGRRARTRFGSRALRGASPAPTAATRSSTPAAATSTAPATWASTAPAASSGSPTTTTRRRRRSSVRTT